MKLPILYKRSNSKDHINQWEIEIEGDSFRTITGFVGMKLFTGDWTKCSEKNIGKKNATTIEEQALAEAKALWTKRKSLGYWEDINDCDKKVFFEPMLAKDFLKEKIKYPLGSSKKLDGIRAISHINGVFSRNGKEIISAPHINEALKPLFEKYPDLVLDGELYAEKDTCDFNTIVSCVRKTKPNLIDLDLSKQYIKYYVYDIPNFDGNDYVYMERINILRSIINDIPELVLVGYEIVNNKEELQEKLAQYIFEGYEGQMLRVLDSLYESKRSKGLLKHKEFFDEEFIIENINEGIGKFANKAATISFTTQDGIKVDATINGTMQYLEEVWRDRENLIGKTCTCKYFEKTSDLSLRFPKIINIAREDYE